MAHLAIRPHPRMPHTVDPGSIDWPRALSGTGRSRDVAVERLHAQLLRAARSEVARRTVAEDGWGELDELALQAADDALVAVLGKLHTYRGGSRFTTWAHKFVLLEAAVRLRRRQWIGRELPSEADAWALLTDDRAELVRAVRDAIAEGLTPQERAVLVALTLNDVPIDVLAERLGTTRGALYKTLHDGRRKLRARLREDGWETDA